MTKKTTTKKKATSMKELLKEGEEIRSFRRGQIIEGSVISTSHNALLLDVGGKGEGIVTGRELEDEDRSFKNLKEGDKVLVSVVQPEDAQGYLVLSLRRSEQIRKWKEMERIMGDGDIIEAKILDYNRGGVLVEVMGIRGFVPLSHMDSVHFSEVDRSKAAGSLSEVKQRSANLKGKKIKVKIIELDKKQNRLVLSEKKAEKISEKELSARAKKLESLKIGDKVKGIVVSVLPFGLFTDIDGLEGLVHISEMSWEKVNHPGDLYKIGDKVKGKVLKKSPAEGSLEISIKQTLKNPWEDLEKKYPVGKKVKGKVSKVVPFGAFVNLEPGLDGLIHVSETIGPIKEGEKIEAVVVNSSSKMQKLALSVRKLAEEGKKFLYV